MNYIKAMEVRKSVRSYQNIPVNEGIITTLKNHFKEECNTYPNSKIRFEVLSTANDMKQANPGFLYGIGKINAPASFVCIYEEDADLLKLSRIMEKEVLYLTTEDLGTVILGTYNEKALRKTCNLSPKEKISVIVSFGIPQDGKFLNTKFRSLAGSTKRKSIEEILLNYEEAKENPTLIACTQHAILSPSANNKQPVRIKFADCNTVEFYVRGNGDHALVDAGIFIEHFFLCAKEYYKELYINETFSSTSQINGFVKVAELSFHE